MPLNRDGLPHGMKGLYDKFARRRTRELIGRVPAKTNYSDFLKRQSFEFQKDVLGVTKAKLFRDGGLTLDKFVDASGDPFTLKELAEKYTKAFSLAEI